MPATSPGGGSSASEGNSLFWTQMLSRPKATPLSYLHLPHLSYSLSSVDTIVLNISIAGVWTLSAVLHSDRPGKRFTVLFLKIFGVMWFVHSRVDSRLKAGDTVFHPTGLSRTHSCCSSHKAWNTSIGFVKVFNIISKKFSENFEKFLSCEHLSGVAV